jgi:hypothetical protein
MRDCLGNYAKENKNKNRRWLLKPNLDMQLSGVRTYSLTIEGLVKLKKFRVIIIFNKSLKRSRVTPEERYIAVFWGY